MSANLSRMLQELGIGAGQLQQAEIELVKEDIVIWNDFRAWVRRAKGVAESTSAAVGRVDLFLYDGQDPPGPSLRSVCLELSDVAPSFAVADDSDAFAATMHTR